MILSEAILCATKMLGLENVQDEINNFYLQYVKHSKDLAMLIDCANFVYSEICSEYFKLETVETMLPTSNKVPFDSLQKDIFQLLCVTNENGKPLNYSIFPLYFEICDKFAGNIIVKYYYIPKQAESLSDSLEIDKCISTRIFAYGICSEYHLLCGNYDESLMFDKKFRDSLLAVAPKRNIKVPVREF